MKIAIIRKKKNKYFGFQAEVKEIPEKGVWQFEPFGLRYEPSTGYVRTDEGTIIGSFWYVVL